MALGLDQIDENGIPDLDQRLADELERSGKTKKTQKTIKDTFEYIEEEREGHSEYYHTDEEAENNEGQKEDMKIYLSKLNKKIDVFVDSLKAAEMEIADQTKEEKIAEIVNQNAENPDLPVRTTFHGFFKDKMNEQA